MYVGLHPKVSPSMQRTCRSLHLRPVDPTFNDALANQRCEYITFRLHIVFEKCPVNPPDNLADRLRA